MSVLANFNLNQSDQSTAMPFGGLTYDWKGPKIEASEGEKRSIAEYLVETGFGTEQSDGTWKDLGRSTMLWYLSLLREYGGLAFQQYSQREELVFSVLFKRMELSAKI